MDAPKGWTNEEWYEFQDYMSGLTCQEQEIQIQSMKALGEAKSSGKNVIIINQYYEM